MTELSRKDFLRLSAGVALTSLAASDPLGSSTAKADAIPKAAGRLLIRGADLLTMDTASGNILAGDLLVEGDRIAAIGRNVSVTDAEIVDAHGMILMPGMIDGHRHIWEGIEAGHLVKTEPRLYNTYQDSKKKVMVCLTADDHHLAGYIGGLQAIDSGVTTVADYAHVQYSTDRALGSARGLKESGIGGWFAYQISHSPSYGPGATLSLRQANTEQQAMADEAHFQTMEALRHQIFSDSRAPLQLAAATSVGIFGKPMPLVRAEMERIRATGVPLISMHIHKAQKPLPAGCFGARGSGIADLHDAGLLGPDIHLAHANDVTSDELSMLRDTGGMICSTAMGEFPYRAEGSRGSVHARARRAGVASGIGIDVGVALPQDYFEHIRAAFWNLYLDAESMEIAQDYKSEDTLDFATGWGAKGVRLDKLVGTLTVGKRADLVLLRTDRFGFASMGSLADRVVNFGSTADIDSVWLAGVRRKKAGKMIGVDWQVLKRQAMAVQERVARQAATITFT